MPARICLKRGRSTLPPLSPARSATSATDEESRELQGLSVADVAYHPANVADDTADVADNTTTVAATISAKTLDKSGIVAHVADVADLAGDRGAPRGGGNSQGNGQDADGSRRICAHCGAADGALLLIGTPSGTAWLHRDCERVWWLHKNPQAEGVVVSVQVEEIPVSGVLQ